MPLFYILFIKNAFILKLRTFRKLKELKEVEKNFLLSGMWKLFWEVFIR